MKTSTKNIVLAICVFGLLASATAQTDEMTDDTNNPSASSGQSGAPSMNDESASENSGGASSDSASPQESEPTPGKNSDLVNLHFNNAPLNVVLNYLSDAAGFIVVQETRVSGNITVNGSNLTKDEVVDLLNSELNRNGYAAIRNGRTLTIVNRNDAKTQGIPVITGNNPNKIPRNDEIVTQIIPILYVEAKQLVTDLSPFVSPQATIVANDAGNSIIITDTQSNIRHLMEIIHAIDTSAQGETVINVFHLSHANPTDVASELGTMFPNSSSTGNNGTQAPIRFGGFGRGFGGFGAAANAASSTQNARVQKQSQVVAVADMRTSSVIVSASKDLMEQISGMIGKLDVSSSRDQEVRTFKLKNNTDPQEALQVLQTMFSGNNSTATSRGGSTSTSSQTENSFLQQRLTQSENNMTVPGQSGSGTSGSSIGSGGGGNGRAGF